MFFHNSPFSAHFRPVSFNLRTYVENSKNGVPLRATFWMQYPVDTGVHLAVYDDREARYTFECYPDNDEEVDKFIDLIANEFGVEVSYVFAERAKRFLTLQRDSFTIDVELDSIEPVMCDTCGDDDSHHAFKGAYFPAFGKEVDAIEVRHETGCIGSTKQYASSDDPKRMQEVWKIINTAIENATDEDSKAEIEAFKWKLRETLVNTVINGDDQTEVFW